MLKTIKYASEGLKNNEDCALAAACQNGMILESFDLEFQTNHPEIVWLRLSKTAWPLTMQALLLMS